MASNITIGATNFPADGSWHFATVENDPAKQSFYLDGKQVACEPENNAVPNQILIGDEDTRISKAGSLYVDDGSLSPGKNIPLKLLAPCFLLFFICISHVESHNLAAEFGVQLDGNSASLCTWPER